MGITRVPAQIQTRQTTRVDNDSTRVWN